MSRGSSQSWWGRAARPGPATQRGRAGATTPGVGDPSYARPSLEPAGSSPLGHYGGTNHGHQCCLAGGAALPGGWRWGGVSALSWGRGAPSRAGKGAGSPVWLRSRLRSDQAPGTGRWSRAPPGPHSLYCPARSWTTEARVFDPNRRLWVAGVGSAAPVPSGQRAEGRQFRASRLRIGYRAATEEGRRRGLGRSWREKPGNGPQGERSRLIAHNPARPPFLPPCSLLPRSKPGSGCAPFLQPRERTRRSSSRGLEGRFTDACAGKPSAQGHLEQSPERDPRGRAAGLLKCPGTALAGALGLGALPAPSRRVHWGARRTESREASAPRRAPPRP